MASSSGASTSAPLPSAAASPNNEKNNYIRLSMLLVDIGTDVLRLVFDSIHPPSTLHAVLNSSRVHSDLQRLRTNRVLYTSQWETLYPPIGGSAVTSNNFDITLLFLLLRNICNLIPPLTGWTNDPSPTDHTMAADLVRIKKYRNEIYAHKARMALSEHEFQYLWTETEAALIRLGRACTVDFTPRIQRLRVEALDADKEKYVNVLLQSWEEGEDRILDAMQNLALDNEQILHAVQENRTKSSITIHGVIKAVAAGGAVVAWAAGSAYFLNRYKDDPETVIRLVQEAIIPASLAAGALVCVTAILPGSFKIVVEVDSLHGLEFLWKRYMVGQLRRDLEEVILTDEYFWMELDRKVSEMELCVTLFVEDYRKASKELGGYQTSVLDGSVIAMFKAIEEENEDAVQKQIKTGVDVNASDGYRTPLWCSAGSLAITEALIKAGADVNLQIKSKETPLMRASEMANLEVVKMLLDAGADVNVKNEYGQTALFYAVQRVSKSLTRILELVTMLLNAGADVTVVDKFNRTVLSRVLARIGMNTEGKRERTDEISSGVIIFCKLVEYGADVNFKDDSGRTALWYAVKSRTVESVTLIDAGADVNVHDQQGVTPLMLAAQNNSKTIVDALIEKGAIVDMQDDEGRTALWYCADHDICDALIQASANLNAKNKFGRTPLIHAIMSSKKDAIKLIKIGADINIADHSGKTALIHAAENDEQLIVQELIAAGADVNIADNEGMTALAYAAGHHKYGQLQLFSTTIGILFSAGADVNRLDNNGRTLLMFAVRNRHLEGKMIFDILARVSNVNARDKEGKTALMLAAKTRDSLIVERLLEAGANPNAVDEDGKTALMYAAAENCSGIVEVLIKFRADVNTVDNKGKTALMFATENTECEVTRILIRNGAEINVKDKDGKTALMHAAMFPNGGVVQILLDSNANVDVEDNLGKTALMHSTKNRYEEVLQILLQHGVNVNATDKEGNTAFVLAATNPNEVVIQSLIKSGADVNLSNKDGRTALMLAAKENPNPKVVKALCEAGAETTATDRDGKSAADYVADNQNKTVQDVWQTLST